MNLNDVMLVDGASHNGVYVSAGVMEFDGIV